MKLGQSGKAHRNTWHIILKWWQLMTCPSPSLHVLEAAPTSGIQLTASPALTTPLWIACLSRCHEAKLLVRISRIGNIWKQSLGGTVRDRMKLTQQGEFVKRFFLARVCMIQFCWCHCRALRQHGIDRQCTHIRDSRFKRVPIRKRKSA